jgi:hypothetical protein
LRRDRSGDAAWTTLPAEGRQGPPPEWPLSRQTIRERHWWAEVWAKPQGIQWERAGQVVEVAMYVRQLTKAEAPKASVALVTQVRQLADALGLTIPGMRVHRWRIAVDQVAEKRAEATEVTVEPTSSARDRFRVVDGAAG